MIATVTPEEAIELRYLYRRRRASRPVQRVSQPFEATWREWLTTLFPGYFGTDQDGFVDHHAAFWDWLWAIEPGVEPPPFVGIWPRGGGKTTNAQGGVAALAARGKRSYGLYVSATQDQANDRIDGIRDMLESPEFARVYPDVGARAETKYSSSRGWRMNRLTTASGFRLDAVGLDTGVRGAKFDEHRPDFIVLDDIDQETDTPAATRKKIAIITRRLLPAGSPDVAVLAIQNMVLTDGIFARLADDAREPADFLIDRIASTPIPAIYDMEFEEADGRATITGGRPSWPQRMDIPACQSIVNREGMTAFLIEQQHEVRERGSQIYDMDIWNGQNRYSVHDAALLARVVGRFVSWDTASSLNGTAAYSAAVTGDVIPFRGGYALLIRDVWRERLEIPQLNDAIEKQARKWGFDVNPRAHDKIVIEYASSGIAAVQTIKSLSTTIRGNAPSWLARFVERFPPLGSKDARGAAAAVYCRHGRVWLPEPDPAVPFNLMEFESELRAVPNATYRDMTDAFANLCLYLRGWLREPGQTETKEAA